MLFGCRANATNDRRQVSRRRHFLDMDGQSMLVVSVVSLQPDSTPGNKVIVIFYIVLTKLCVML
jgi:hypothetical protein